MATIHNFDTSALDQQMEFQKNPGVYSVWVEHVDEKDVLAATRESQGLERIDQLKYAVLERSGGISIIPAEGASRAHLFVRPLKSTITARQVSRSHPV
jgi:hypothetical protein